MKPDLLLEQRRGQDGVPNDVFREARRLAEAKTTNRTGVKQGEKHRLL
jgi:hypothetical protein